MILSASSILEAITKNDIVIVPYDRNCLGTNSYDVHLSKFLACYTDEIIDAKNITKSSTLRSRRKASF